MNDNTGLGLLEASRKFEISPQLIRYWIRKGWVIQLESPVGPGKPLKLDEQSLINALKRYKPRNNPSFIQRNHIGRKSDGLFSIPLVALVDGAVRSCRKLRILGNRLLNAVTRKVALIGTEMANVPLNPFQYVRNFRTIGVGFMKNLQLERGRIGAVGAGKLAWLSGKRLFGAAPRRMLVASAVTAILIGFLMTASTTEAITLSSTCTPPSLAQGGEVKCTLNISINAGANEHIPIDKLRVQVGSERIDFNLEGTLIGTGNSSAIAITKTPLKNPGTGYGYGASSKSLFGYGFGYSSGYGYGFTTLGPGPVGVGYGYSLGSQFFQALTYEITITTTTLPVATHSVQFILLTGDSNVTKFITTGTNEATFTVTEAAACDTGFVLTNGNCVAAVASTGGTVDEILGAVADLVPSQAADVIDNIVDVGKRAQVLTSLPESKTADVAKAMNTEKLAEALNAVGDGASGVIESLAEDDEGTSKAAAVLEVIAEKDPFGAAQVIEKVQPSAAAKVVDKVEKKAAGKILTELPVGKRTDIILNMNVDSLKDRLAEVSPAAIKEIETKKLLEKLPTVSAEALSKNSTPKVEPTLTGGRVVQTFGNVAIYEIASTGERVWVMLVGSPDPIDQVIAQFTENLSNVSIVVNPLGIKKPVTAPVLPKGLVAGSYFFVTPNVDPDKIRSGVIGFFVEKSWLAKNGFHKWSVVLYRLDSERNEWQATPTQRTSEDETRVHYDAPVPGFSLFAITGGAEPASFSFTVASLQISPVVAVEGADVTVTASVTNTGTTDETFPINLSVNDVVDDSVSIAVAAGSTETITFTTTQPLGTYEVRVDRLFGNFTVETQQVATPTPEPTATPVPPQPTATTAPAPTATSAPAPAATATRVPAPAATATSVPPPAATATRAPAPAATVTSAPAPEPTAVATFEPADDDDDGNLGLIIGIIIVVVVIGGGIAFFALRSRRRV